MQDRILSEAEELSSSLLAEKAGSGAAASLVTAVAKANGIAGFVLTVGYLAVDTITYHIKKQKEEARLAEIKTVLEIHKKYLAEIKVNHSFEPFLSLPAPFEIDQGNKESPVVKGITLPDGVIREMTRSNNIIDLSLQQYKSYVGNAKQYIRDFYNEKGIYPEPKNTYNTTSCVLLYLLMMLDKHCTGFEGYDADIAYLDALISFINAFASIPPAPWYELFYTPDLKDFPRFQRLARVCSELYKAKQELLDHRTARTLKSFVDELASACNNTLIPDLTEFYAKLISPQELWPNISSATMGNLREGIIRPQYDNDTPQIEIPQSVFKEWLMAVNAQPNVLDARSIPLNLNDDLSQILFEKYHFLALKAPQLKANGKEEKANGKRRLILVGEDKECFVMMASKVPPILTPGSFVLIKDKETSNWQLYEIKPNKQCVELKIDDVPELRAALTALPPGVKPEDLKQTQQAGVNSALTDYRNRAQFRSRAQIFLDLALLLKQLVDLSNFCAQLSQCIQDLGEIYMNDPHHCNFIFDVLRLLGKNICDRARELQRSLDKMESEQIDPHDMLLEEQSNLKAQLLIKLNTIHEKVSNTTHAILEKHRKNSKGDPRQIGAVHIEKYNRFDKKGAAISKMLEIADMMWRRYKDYYKQNSSFDNSQASGTPNGWGTASEEDENGRRRHNSLASLARALTGPFEAKIIPGELSPASTPLLDEDKSSANGSARTQVAQASAPIDNVRADTLLINIRERIKEITTRELTNKKTEAAAYAQLFGTLNKLYLQARNMQGEKDMQRQKKGELTEKLVLRLCKTTGDFLNKSASLRKQEVHSWSGAIKRELAAPGNNFLDEHKSIVGKILRAVKELVLCLAGVGFYTAYQRGGFFKTDARAAAHQVGLVSEELETQLTISPIDYNL